MRRATLISITLSIMLGLCAPVEAASVDMGGTLTIEHEPESLTLAPGEDGVVQLQVRNTADHALWVGIEFVRIESPWGSSGEVTPDYFQLGPGDSQSVRVVVTSHAEFRRSEPGDSDGTLKFWWGPNLTREPDGEIDHDTATGDEWLEIPVKDDFSLAERSTTWLLMAMVFIAVVAVVLFMSDRRRRKLRAVPVAGPGAILERGPPDT